MDMLTSENFTTAITNITVCWLTTPCSLVEVYQNFSGHDASVFDVKTEAAKFFSLSKRLYASTNLYGVLSQKTIMFNITSVTESCGVTVSTCFPYLPRSWVWKSARFIVPFVPPSLKANFTARFTAGRGHSLSLLFDLVNWTLQDHS